MHYHQRRFLKVCRPRDYNTAFSEQIFVQYLDILVLASHHTGEIQAVIATFSFFTRRQDGRTRTQVGLKFFNFENEETVRIDYGKIRDLNLLPFLNAASHIPY